MENKGKTIKPPVEEHEAIDRTRTFKKPLDSLGARQERIEMVKGLVLESEKLCYGEKKKNSIKMPGEEEPSDSSLTHDEIRQWVAKYHISWQ